MKRFLVSSILVLAAILNLQAQDKSVKFAYMADIHLCEDSPRIHNLELCIEDINSQKDIQFTMFGGDITEFGADNEIALAKGVIDKLTNPYYIIAGNHDAKWSESGTNTFAKIFGYETFDFTAGGVRFLGCNSGPNMRMAPALMPHETLCWIEDIVKTIPEDQPVIFINHFPQDSSMLNYFQVVNALKGCNIQMILGGHWHNNTILDYQGVPGVLGRSPDKGKSIAYNIISIDNGKLEIRQKNLVDKDGNPVDSLGEPWYTLQLSDKPKYTPYRYDRKTNPYGLPDDFPWMTFSVNEEFPKVKSVWSLQDESDVGCAAVWCGKYVAYANTQGKVKVVESGRGRKLWSYQTEGKIFSTPAVADGKLVIGSTDNFIYCFNVKNGKLLWKYECEKSVLASPVIQDGIAYVGSSDGKFRALNLKDGKLIWSFDFVKGFVESKPFIDENQVVFGDWANTLYSLDPRSGALQWKWENHGSRMLSPAAVWPVKSNGKIFIATPERKSYAIDAATGQTVWQTKGGRESVALSPDGNRYYIKTMSNQMQAFSTQGDKVEKIWEVCPGFNYEIGPTPCSCAGELVFVPTDKGNIFCLNASDGSTVWKHKVSVALINSIVPVGNDKILVSTMDGVITLLKYK